jgi:hypothetical protein
MEGFEAGSQTPLHEGLGSRRCVQFHRVPASAGGAIIVSSHGITGFWRRPF